jgi:DNA-binding IclR family transcriptional regulator
VEKNVIPHRGTADRPAPSGVTPLKLLDRTLSLLGAFTPAEPEWGVTELAGRLALPKSTVHRILHVLTAHRYLARDPGTGRFRLGPGALELGRHAMEGLELRRIARPVLARLARASGETVVLAVPSDDGQRAVCLARVESPLPLRIILEEGAHVPLHAGATSKILLAHMAPEHVERVLAGGLRRLARGTITHPALLRRDLARIRLRGYACSREETNEGAAGVAAPVLAGDGTIVAGVSLVGPVQRFGAARLPHLVALARGGAAELAGALGLGPARSARRAPGPAGVRPLGAPSPAPSGHVRSRPRRRAAG